MTVTIMQRNPKRTQAHENGDLIDVSEIAREDTFVLPTAITRRAWHAVIARPVAIANPTIDRGTADLVRHLLRFAHREIQRRWREDLQQLEFDLPNKERPFDKATTSVVIVSTVDDEVQPALTIGLPEEFELTSAANAA